MTAYSVWEPRLIALLASKVKQDDEDFQTYEIPIRELIGHSKKGASGKTYQELTKVVEHLMGRILTIHDSSGRGWTKYTVFSKCRYRHEDGMLELRFDPDLKPHYLQLQKNFVKYNLMEFLLLPSIYSQRLFEYLKSWSSEHEHIESIHNLHELLNSSESSRKNFAEFKRHVLEKAHKDITAHTSLRYEWEPVKQGRAVVAVRFIFAKKRALPIEKKKQDNAKVKQSRANNEAFNTATSCYQERGNDCQGGHQKAAVCSLCRHLYPRSA